MKMRFYICKHCGKVSAVAVNSELPPFCCGEVMSELTANTTDAATEKHIPVYETAGNTIKVTVGETEHPMLPEHHIMWIALETRDGCQIKALRPNDKPHAEFALCDGDEPTAVYAYCNLHGLWKAEVAKAEPSETSENGNYTVCKCNNVSYFDILDEIHKHGSIDGLMNAFADVKDATKCTTGCGGCYDKVMKIISDEING